MGHIPNSAKKKKSLEEALFEMGDFIQNEISKNVVNANAFFSKKYDNVEDHKKSLKHNISHVLLLFADLNKGQIPSVGMSTAATTITFISGAFQLLEGAILLSKDTLHPMRDKAMGIAKVLSGAASTALSYAPWLTQFGQLGLTGSAALTGPAFALTRLVDLTCAAIDCHYAVKELKFSGWLEERYKELNNINKKLDRNPEKKEKLLAKKMELEDDIRARLFCENIDASEALQFKSKKIMDMHTNFCHSIKEISTDISPRAKNHYERKNEFITKEMKKNAKDKSINVALKALALSGAIMLAAAPFSGPAAPVLFALGAGISIAVFAYSGGKVIKENKNIKQLFNDVSHVLNHAVNNVKDKMAAPSYIPRL